MTASNDSPHPKRFYKYASASGALGMLRTMSVWWKSPTLFNDPFDTQIELNMGCNVDEVAAAIESRVLHLVPLHRGCEGFRVHAAACITGWSHLG